MTPDEIKEYILKDTELAKYFDLDKSGSIEKDELLWFIHKAQSLVKQFDKTENAFEIRKKGKTLGVYKFREFLPEFFNTDCYIRIPGDTAWFPLYLLNRIYREGISEEQEINDAYAVITETQWFEGPELLIFNSSQQRLYYSGIIKDKDDKIVIARVKSDPNYANAFFFLTIVPGMDYSSRKKYRKIMTARILVDDNRDRPCFEVIVDPGIGKFGHYNVYDRRNTALQSVHIGSIKKSLAHFLYPGSIACGSKKIIVTRQASKFLFKKGARDIAVISRVKIPLADAIIENKRCSRLEFLEERLSGEEKVLIISYFLATDHKFWVSYRY